MSFFAPIPLIRRKHIFNCLRKCGATLKEIAKILVINPNAFKAITEKLIKNMNWEKRMIINIIFYKQYKFQI